MNYTTKHFKVTSDSTGDSIVRAFPGIDTGLDVMFNKTELEAEVAELVHEAFHSGKRAGRASLQENLRSLLRAREI